MRTNAIEFLDQLLLDAYGHEKLTVFESTLLKNLIDRRRAQGERHMAISRVEWLYLRYIARKVGSETAEFDF